MKKPTENQIKVINECIMQLECWKSTNDLYSGTHGGDTDAGLLNLELDDIITENQSNELSSDLSYLLTTIRNIK